MHAQPPSALALSCAAAIVLRLVLFDQYCISMELVFPFDLESPRHSTFDVHGVACHVNTSVSQPSSPSSCLSYSASQTTASSAESLRPLFVVLVTLQSFNLNYPNMGEETGMILAAALQENLALQSFSRMFLLRGQPPRPSPLPSIHYSCDVAIESCDVAMSHGRCQGMATPTTRIGRRSVFFRL